MTKIRSTDDSNIQDRRGQRGAGGGLGIPGFGRGGRGGGGMPIPMKGGGGILGLLVIAAIVFLPRLLDSSASPSLITPEGAQDAGADGEACQSEGEQIVCGAFNDAQRYWTAAYPQAFGGAYQVTDLVFYSRGTQTGCGSASSQVGPFYCPADGFVYIDLEFLDELQRRFGAEGDLATAYIVAHELGHHVQNLNGTNAQVQRASGERQRVLGIALELQADCLAGTWVHDAERRRNAAGEPLIDRGELSEALGAASAVGDDAIQQQDQGRVDIDSFTHGSSAQREQWFRRGYETGDPTRCNTFDEV